MVRERNQTIQIWEASNCTQTHMHVFHVSLFPRIRESP